MKTFKMLSALALGLVATLNLAAQHGGAASSPTAQPGAGPTATIPAAHLGSGPTVATIVAADLPAEASSLMSGEPGVSAEREPRADGAAAATQWGFITLDRAAARALVDPAAYDRPAILALWSLECVHCKKNLALFAQMANSYGVELELLTLAVEPAAAALAEVLERFGVPGARYAYGRDMPEALAYAIDPNWRGELPRTLFFDGRGGVVAVSGVVGEADVFAWLGLGRAPRASR